MTDVFREMADAIDNIKEVKERVGKIEAETVRLNGAIQIVNKEIRQVRQESQANQMHQFLNTINTRVNDKLAQVTTFFVDVKKRVFPTNITQDMLREIISRTGVKQKELAVELGYNPEDLAAVSRVISGERDDAYKRWVIYNYCNQQLNEIIKNDKTKVEL
jgi:hypothetical protein